MKKITDFFWSLFSDLCIMIGVMLLLFNYVILNGVVNGESMLPTLVNNQRVLADQITYSFSEPKRFDIVAVQFPNVDSMYVKRVIGLPGEKIMYVGGKLYVNGEEVAEPFLPADARTGNFNTLRLFPTTNGVIPENNYLVIGDNRNNSQDSRVLGTLEKEAILGRLRVSFFPLDRIGIV